MTLEKKCIICGNTFYKESTCSLKRWNESRRFCSQKCLSKDKEILAKRKAGIVESFKQGREIWNKGTKGLQVAWNKGNGEYAKKLGFGKWMIGRKLTEEHKRHIGEAQQGDKSASWKGAKAKYGSKHMWIYKMKGKPETCEHCGKTGLTGHQRQWANKDHKYSRNLEDWINLCISCHIKYDKKFN